MEKLVILVPMDGSGSDEEEEEEENEDEEQPAITEESLSELPRSLKSVSLG